MKEGNSKQNKTNKYVGVHSLLRQHLSMMDRDGGVKIQLFCPESGQTEE